MIKVFTGPMYSGKSLRLISEYNNIWNKDRVKVFKPSKDTREYSKLYSRSSKSDIPCKVISDLNDILDNLDDNTSTIFIDEVQFLSGSVDVLTSLSLKGIDIYIAGLSLTSELKPFGLMPDILAVADEIEHCVAYCFDCNKHNAKYTYCLIDKQDDILVDGKTSIYLPLCSQCLSNRLKLEGGNNNE